MTELNKQQARLYNDDKACDEVMRHLSATYLLFSLGINHFGQAEDYLAPLRSDRTRYQAGSQPSRKRF